jgi:hypothetical protein
MTGDGTSGTVDTVARIPTRKDLARLVLLGSLRRSLIAGPTEAHPVVGDRGARLLGELLLR